MRFFCISFFMTNETRICQSSALNSLCTHLVEQTRRKRSHITAGIRETQQQSAPQRLIPGHRGRRPLLWPLRGTTGGGVSSRDTAGGDPSSGPSAGRQVEGSHPGTPREETPPLAPPRYDRWRLHTCAAPREHDSWSQAPEP